MKTCISLLLLVTSFTISSQNYKFDYDKLCQEDKREELLALLNKWQKEQPNDAELYVAFFNYYYLESKKEVVQLDSKPGKGDNLVISDSTSQDPVGYMYSKIHYDESHFNLAMKYIDEGLVKHPNRLDMHFGKIHVLREKGRYQEHVSEILKVIDLHNNQTSNWLWTNNDPVEDQLEMFKSSIQSYCYELFNLGDQNISGIELISSKMIKSYPNDIKNYSNLGVCKLIKGEFNEALSVFLKAIKLQPNDTIVLANIAYAYMQLEDKKNAIKYYKRVSDLGNNQEKEFANKQIKQLEDK